MLLPGQFRAVVFDCDGVLADSEPLAVSTWTGVLAPYGYRPQPADVTASLGRTFPDVRDLYAAHAPTLPSAAELAAVFDESFLRLLGTELTPWPDAVGLARRWHGAGVRLAVASSSPRRRLDETLRLLGIAGLFASITAGDEVEHPKPAPDPYLAAAAGLGVLPEHCLAIEDSQAGVASALAAGMTAVGVRRDPDADLSAAHLVLPDLSELDVRFHR